MPSPHQIEILDLRHFSGQQLRPLLEEEAAIWLMRLRWDYRSSTELLLQYLDSRILPGFVAKVGGRICGYTFFVYEGTKAVVGDLYVSETSSRSLIERVLAENLGEVLNHSPGISRIEAQLLLYEKSYLPSLFPGFTVYPRLFLERALNSGRQPPSRPEPTLSPECELCPWGPTSYQPAAELIHAAYQGHIDSDINDQYRTLAGSLRFLHNVVRFPGCGIFDPDASWVLRERVTQACVGIVLCSCVIQDQSLGPVAHVTQLCVAPRFRGLQLGRLLLNHCMAQLRDRGFRYITLTVSEANAPALNLYRSIGFQIRQQFDAVVTEKTNFNLSKSSPRLGFGNGDMPAES